MHARACVHICTHMHTHHTGTHRHRHTRTHAPIDLLRACTCAHAHTRAHTHSHTRSHIHAYMSMHTRASTQHTCSSTHHSIHTLCMLPIPSACPYLGAAIVMRRFECIIGSSSMQPAAQLCWPTLFTPQVNPVTLTAPTLTIHRVDKVAWG